LHGSSVLVSCQYARQNCSSGLAAASDGDAGWPDERCRSLVESAAVLLLLDLLLQCSLDARIVVTDVSDASIKVIAKVTLQLTVSQSICLGVKPHPGIMARYFFLFES
jgi:hypothetical protein